MIVIRSDFDVDAIDLDVAIKMGVGLECGGGLGCGRFHQCILSS